ncbi:heavy-metal-associated domain-containing protein [Actinomadura sp. HBU206391]|uniref:heavy-metal-associated domain-containing protein n=1 Tax=Actinomadura sp. HBU206391 TaxID=2731692 RepID=UPI00164F2E3E|nr:heavy-metal-associated domain-containing protein [Actinomadura sp. HBU206391]MBC6460124.1 heavy-metal-associated domain-containing protein [Actinomadura sp. HBU206391]
MATATFNVSGMSCGHCANAVTEELSRLAGIEHVDVADGLVRVSGGGQIDDESICAAIEDAGYAVVS